MMAVPGGVPSSSSRFLTSSTNLLIGRSRNLGSSILLPCLFNHLVAILIFACRTRSSSLTLVSSTLPNDHWFRGRLSSRIITTSPSVMFTFLSFHFDRGWRLCRYSFFQRLQNSLARCCTLRHLRRTYLSSLSNVPGGGMTTLLFPVKIIFGFRGIRSTLSKS